MPLRKSGGPFVGIDIGSSLIKAVEIECKGGKPVVRGLAVQSTPPDAVANDEITDPVALGKVIKQMLAGHGIKARKAVVSVAGQSALVVRIIEVPKMTRAELHDTMKWEVERHVPFAAEQVVMDYELLVDPEDVPEGQNMEVLLAVAQENLVTRQVEALQAAGLQPVAIDIAPLAMSRALIDLANGSGPAGTVAVVNLGASSSDICIYRDGKIAFTRSIQIAGNALTKAISDVLGQPLADAEQLKTQKANVPVVAPAAEPDATIFGDMDFGQGGDDPLAGLLGGTFGMASSAPGESTATDTHAEPDLNIAGGGFSPDAFTTPSEESDPTSTQPGADTSLDFAPGASPFDAPSAASASPFDAPVASSANPFDTPIGFDTPVETSTPTATEPAGNAPASGLPADLFGPVPQGNLFAPMDDEVDFASAPAPDLGAPDLAAPSAPAAMSDEDYLKTQITDAIMPILDELATELRRSLDFYRNRANGLGAQQVLVCGGTAQLPGLVEYLTANLEVPVVLGNPMSHVNPGPKVDPNQLQSNGPVCSVSVGLAVRELLMDPPAPKRPKSKPAPKAKATTKTK